MPDATKVPLKGRADYKLLGKRYTGVDNLKVVTGQPLFGIDVQMPGMLYANYTKCPAVGGKVKSANLDEIKKMPGVVDVFALEGTGNPTGGDAGCRDHCQVHVGDVQSQGGTESRLGRERCLQGFADTGCGQGERDFAQAACSREQYGDVDAAFANAAKVVDAAYDYAMVSHQQLEPETSTAWWHDGVMEIWSPVSRQIGV